jgi:hypothetical protein
VHAAPTVSLSNGMLSAAGKKPGGWKSMFYTVADASIKIKGGRRTSAKGHRNVDGSCEHFVQSRYRQNTGLINNYISTSHIIASICKI